MLEELQQELCRRISDMSASETLSIGIKEIIPIGPGKVLITTTPEQQGTDSKKLLEDRILELADEISLRASLEETSGDHYLLCCWLPGYLVKEGDGNDEHSD